ncbi:MAG: DoxX family protein [Bdellovibrionota bacterium]
MKRLYLFFISKLQLLADLPPLLFRFILAYGFYGPAMEKATHFNDIVVWFGETLHIPFPKLNAIMAVSTECAGVVLMILGLATRLISIPMMVIMLVAIKTVHLPDGWAACETVRNADEVIERVKHGVEIPVYYLCMLFWLLIAGPGKFSLDAIIKRKMIDER